MQIIADLQIHSRFSRAVSPQMTIPNIALWAKRKGIGLMATGDWTHPMWFREIERDLEEAGNGLLQLRAVKSIQQGAEVARKNFDPSPYFLLATEVSSIYTQNGKGRRVHTLIWVPTIDSARKISQEMTKRGCNLLSDGRPIIGLSSIHVAELVLSIEPKALIIPAHCWTPWFALFGSMSGFDSIEEAFGPYAKNIYAVETGLSSNPSMNWQIKELDNRAILSFSDAHSCPKIGREATVFEIPDGQLSYDAIYNAIKYHPARGDENFLGSAYSDALLANENFDDSSNPSRNSIQPSIRASSLGSEQSQNFVRSPRQASTNPHIAYTIEFYPEEGKYHYTGHRACNIRYGSEEVRKKGTTCPVCGKPLTQGVVQRVGQLAGRTEEELGLSVVSCQLSDNGPNIHMTQSKMFPNRPPFVMLVPLQEIISESIGSPVGSMKTQLLYTKLTDMPGGEFAVLLHTSKDEIANIAGEKVATGIEKVRTGDIVIDPGYDGVFGVVKIWKEGEATLVDTSREQLGMF